MTYEDIYFYLDLEKELVKKKELIKQIRFYINEKNKININGHYSVFMFKEDDSVVFVKDKKDAEIITKVINENWKERSKSQSRLESGLFYIFSYIAETIRKKSKLNRVVIITDTPSDLNEEYQDALFNLVARIKNFPTFIDIIRVAEKETRFYKDDVKLNILASDTKGGMFQALDKKALANIFKKLLKSKQYASTFSDRSDATEITTEDYMFYSRLAKDLIKHPEVENPTCYFCHEQSCPVCMEQNDIPYICENCNTPFHSCCATNYTITHNIGIPHIFRCPTCDNLLKMNEEDIVGISEGEEESISIKDYIGLEDLGEIPTPSISEIQPSSQFITEMDDDAPIIVIEDEETTLSSIPQGIEPKTPQEEEPTLSSIPQGIESKAPQEEVSTLSSIPQGIEPKTPQEEEPKAEEPKVAQKKEPKPKKQKLPMGKDIGKVTIGGFFGKAYTITKIGDRLLYQRAQPTSEKESIIEEKPDLEKLAPASTEEVYKDLVSEEKEAWTSDDVERQAVTPHKPISASIKICFSCGMTLPSTVKENCPNCGNKVS